MIRIMSYCLIEKPQKYIWCQNDVNDNDDDLHGWHNTYKIHMVFNLN